MKFPMDRPVKIVMLGAGGTGGYVAPYLFRLLHMLDKDRFAQLLREVPEKDVLFPAPQYSPYIQSLIDRLKEEESLDLAAIDWSAFEMADVTIPFFQDNADDTSRSWIKGLVGRTRTAPIFQSRRRVFF